MQKTNAMRFLDKNKIPYNTYEYDCKDGKIDGVAVANKLNEDVNMVFKTLVVQGHSKELYVFVLPVSEELNLKKAAKVAGEKNVEMIHVKDINKITGYIRGGCSPLGMKKQYKTVIDSSALDFEEIYVSGGKIGSTVKVNTKALAKLCSGSFASLDEN